MRPVTLVLDAMGVMYVAADDVAELLVPFVKEHGGLDDASEVADLYTRASLGEIDAPAFWRAVGVAAEREDEYLGRHSLNAGLVSFLAQLPPRISSVWCLSNDVAEWSRKLRSLHALEESFSGFLVSGDVGVRKPDRVIYEKLLESVGRPAEDVVFVDDRVPNLDAARRVGIRTVRFCSAGGLGHSGAHSAVGSFEELGELLTNKP